MARHKHKHRYIAQKHREQQTHPGDNHQFINKHTFRQEWIRAKTHPFQETSEKQSQHIERNKNIQQHKTS